MSNRKTISKKTRFEVFKRDKFTCQYCGRTAPDVVLEVDHIQPVSKGGKNDIMNLITSCFECNRGKSNKKLNENDELKKQQKMLLELAQRKEQIEMLLQWKNELEKLEEELIDKIEDLFNITGYRFNNQGRTNCKKMIRKYGFEEVYESTKISLEQYYNPNDEETIPKTFTYIGRICSVRKNDKDNPNNKDITYLCKIGKNKFTYFDVHQIKNFLNKHYESNDFNDLKYIFCSARSNSQLENNLYYYYGVD